MPSYFRSARYSNNERTHVSSARKIRLNARFVRQLFTRCIIKTPAQTMPSYSFSINKSRKNDNFLFFVYRFEKHVIAFTIAPRYFRKSRTGRQFHSRVAVRRLKKTCPRCSPAPTYVFFLFKRTFNVIIRSNTFHSFSININ